MSNDYGLEDVVTAIRRNTLAMHGCEEGVVSGGKGTDLPTLVR